MTIEEIDKEIERCEESRELAAAFAREEDDKDYRRGYYANIDRINDRIAELVKMKKAAK